MRRMASGIAVVAAVHVASSAFALQWESIGPDGGVVDGLAQSLSNPDRMYALLYRQGVYRSDDRGASWVRVDVGLGLDSEFEAIAVSTEDSDGVILAPLAGDELLRSTDGGVSWTPTTVAAGLGSVEEVEFDPFDASNVLLTSRGGSAPGVHRSTDGGLTWAESNAGMTSTTPRRIEYHPTTAGTVLVAASDGVFRSTNGGVGWAASSMGGTGTVGAVSYCRSLPAIVWTGTFWPFRLLRSTDGGESFTVASTTSPYFEEAALLDVIVADPVHPDEVFAGYNLLACVPINDTESVITRTTNAGASWSTVHELNPCTSSHPFFSSFSADVELDDVFHATLGAASGNEISNGFVRSTNGGASWQPYTEGLRGLSVAALQADASGVLFMLESDENGLFRTDDAGEYWLEFEIDDETAIRHFEAGRSSTAAMYLVGERRSFDSSEPEIYRSTNRGATWSSAALPPPELFDEPLLFAIDPTNGASAYLWTSSTSLLRTTNSGATFAEVASPLLPSAAVVSPDDPDRVFIAGDSGVPPPIQYSEDAGETWSDWATGPPAANIVALFVLSPSGAGAPGVGGLVAVSRNAGAFLRTQIGASWTPLPLPGYSGQTVREAEFDEATMRFFLRTTAGVYVSGLGFVGTGLTTGGEFARSLAYDRSTDTLFLGTDHSSVFRLRIGDAVEAPAPMVAAPAPSSRLSIRAYPNPSPAGAGVRLTLHVPHGAARARVTLVDVGGRRVAAPFDGALHTGVRDLSWDGRTSTGAPAAPGVYFARIEADGETATARITLVAE